MIKVPQQPGGLANGVADATLDDDTSRLWGITRGPWLWAARVRILFVIDGRVLTTKSVRTFGLGLLLDTLRDESFAWWVRFEIDIAKREGRQVVIQSPGPYGLKYSGFRFDQAAFDLDDYDQVWFFGDRPGKEADDAGVGDEIIRLARNHPLVDAELKIVATWMDGGGGVFAAGDHSLLGASMCSRIPRVRTMRKWTHAQGVPTFGGTTRHETLQPGTTTDVDVREEDVFGQPIEPVFQTIGSPPFVLSRRPHPLLCAGGKVIDTFPDHMHEGEVIEDDDVELRRPLDIAGYDRDEYPLELPIEQPAAARGESGGGLKRTRPRVIAHGTTTNPENPGKRFALISTYNGDRAGIGRVVVDSTWHHWFSLNTRGFKDGNPALYTSIQAYHRNVALWLARPQQRVSALIAASWGAIAGVGPMAFQGPLSPWEIGERTIAVTALTLSSCMLTDIVVATFADDVAALMSGAPGLAGAPLWSRLADDLMNRAMVGGIGAALRDLALDHHDAYARGERPRLDPAEIRERAMRGANDGHRLLSEALSKAANDTAYLRDQLGAGLRAFAPESIPVPIETVAIRVIVERLQFPDPADPALVDGYLTLTVRVRLDGEPIAAHTIEQIAVPAFDPHGGFVHLDVPLAEAVAQSGERLSVELLIGAWSLGEFAPESVRFAATHVGDPSTWLGSHVPDSAQVWRLWYRIEKGVEIPSYS
jgi:hypothetical protein